jgi:hypothetical protein
MEEQEGRMAVDSDEPMSNDENDIIINEVDGLPNVHPNYIELELHHDAPRQNSDGARTMDELIHDEDLPTSLIVTNLDGSIFKDEGKKVIVYVVTVFKVQNIDWTSHSTMLHSSFSLCSLPAVLGLL